jgi:hypothetical protein
MQMSHLERFSQIFVQAAMILTLTACEQTTIGDNWYPGVTLSYSNSSLSVSSTSVASGSATQISLQLRDTNGNPFASTLVTVSFYAQGGTGNGTFSSVINQGGGTYTSTFTGGTVGTPTILHALVSGKELQSALPTVVVTAISNQSISISSGNPQTGTAGSALANPFVVVVKDSSGNPVSGVTVDWSVVSGGGSLSSSSNLTGPAGLSSSTLTLGTTFGSNSATATIHGTAMSVSFSATGTAGTAAKLSFSLQPSGSGTAGTALDVQPVVQLQDSNGNNVTTSGVVISLTLFADSGCSSNPIPTNPKGTASVLSASATTVANGQATFTGFAITDSGSNLWVKASAAGPLIGCSSVVQINASSIDVTESAISAAPSTNVVADGSHSSTVLFTVQDTYGNPIPNQSVSFTVSGSNNTLSTASPVTTTSTGTVSTSLSSTTAETKTIQITGPASLNTLSATVSFVAGAAAIITKTGDSQTSYISTALAVPLGINVTDSNGNLITNTQIDWSIVTGGGSLGSANSTTDGSGNTTNTWTVGPNAGPGSVSATVHGTAVAATFSASINASSPDVLGTNFVGTAESIASSTFGALTTADSVTFNLASATTVYIDYRAMVNQAGGDSQNQLIANFDGVDDTNSTTPESVYDGNDNNSSLVYLRSLAAGSHTIKIRYLTATGVTTWSSRLLVIRKMVGPFLAANYVAESEAIPSDNNTDYNLATLDSVTFTLSSAATVLVEYAATVTSTEGTTENHIYVDGVADSNSSSAGYDSPNFDGSTIFTPSFLAVPESLSAGAHTITIMHAQDAAINSWQSRMLRVTQVSSSTFSTAIVLAVESTTSNAPTDLTTPDTLSFTLAANSNVLIEYFADGATFNNPLTIYNLLNLDGSAVETTGRTSYDGHWDYNTAQYKVFLTSGTHTIHIEHYNGGSGSDSCWWNNRLIKMTLVN